MINIGNIISFDNDQNCYLVYDGNKNGILIDPGVDTMKILRTIEESGVNVTHVFLTHCHYDHIYSVNELRKNRKLVCGEKCSENIGTYKMNLSDAVGMPVLAEPADITVSDNEIIKIGDMQIKCIYTPGHTNCGFCYLIDDALFAGDTLFRRSVGRWDLPGGDEAVLRDSIKNKLFTLSDTTRVFPGHGAETQISYEKKYNHYV